MTQSKQVEYNKTTIANEIGLSQDSFLELFDDYIDEANELSDLIESAVGNPKFFLY